MKKALLVILALFVGLIVLGALLPEQPKKETAADKPATVAETPAATAAEPVEKPLPAALQVAALKLFEDYQSNEVSADQQYKGKTLEVDGTVAGINKNAFGGIYVDLRTSNEFMSIQASGLPEDVAANLKKGQAITVRCTGNGMMMGMPMLGDCSML